MFFNFTLLFRVYKHITNSHRCESLKSYITNHFTNFSFTDFISANCKKPELLFKNSLSKLLLADNYNKMFISIFAESSEQIIKVKYSL